MIRAVTRDPSALRARLGTISSRSTHEVVSGELSAPGVRAGGLTHILAGSARVFLCLPQALSSAGRLASDRPLSWVHANREEQERGSARARGRKGQGGTDADLGNGG